MPIIQQSEPASRPRPIKSLTIYPADEIADFQGCTPEEFWVLLRLRWYAWHHGGIEASEETLFRLRRNLGVSAKKFRKMLPFVLSFFTENSGFLHFTADEDQRRSDVERVENISDVRRKAANSRWARAMQNGVLHNANADAKQFLHDSAPSFPPSHSPSSLPQESAFAAAAVVDSTDLANLAAAAQHENVDRKPPTRQNTEFPEAQKLIASCKKFSDVTPDFVEKLANLARAVDPDLDDGRLCEAIRATFKREKQESAGLWLHTVPAWLQNRRRAASA
jgi:hypothetical protein